MFELAKLDIRDQAGRLNGRNERLHWKALKAAGSPLPRSSLTLSGRVATDHRFKRIAAKQLRPAKGHLALEQDAPLSDLNGAL